MAEPITLPEHLRGDDAVRCLLSLCKGESAHEVTINSDPDPGGSGRRTVTAHCHVCGVSTDALSEVQLRLITEATERMRNPESVCVLCGRPWEPGIKNRCECGGFCTWGPAKGEKPTSWVDYERLIPNPVPPEVHELIHRRETDRLSLPETDDA